MKARICLILLSLMVILPVSGCGRSAQKPEPEPTFAEAPSPARFTTQRRRNPQTGRIETVRVPVRTEADDEQPYEPDAEAAQPAVRRAAAARARATAEPKPDAPKENHFKLDWQEPCSVQKAYSAACWIFETLGLTDGATQLDRQTIYNPQTGQSETRLVPEQGSDWRWDELSAELKGESTTGMEFEVDFLFLPPESSKITITAAGTTHPEDILKEQAGYLRDRISETIQQEPEKEALPYPETVIFNHPVGAVFDAIYQWAENQGFERGSSGQDKYYKSINCEAGSGIRFRFTLRLIGPDKTKLDITISNYKGKDEFPMILKSLKEALVGLKDAQAYTESDMPAGEDVITVP